MSSGEELSDLLEGILERIDLPILLLNENQRILYANSDFLKYFGKDTTEVTGLHINEVISIKGTTDIFAFEDTGPPFDELLITCKSGSVEKEFYFCGQKFPLANGQNGLLIIARDVTLRRKLEQQLQESEEKYREMVDNSNDAIFVIDKNGKFLEVNRKALELYSYSKDEFEKLSFIDLLVADPDPGLVVEQLRDLAENAENKCVEQVHRTKDGREIVVEVCVTRMSPGNQTMLMFVRDLSFRKQIQEQLLKAEKLSTLGAAISTLRHEINNPLTVIMGESQLLMIEHEDLPEKVLVRVKNIHQMGQRISNALMKLSRFVKSEKEETVELAGIKMFKLNDD